MTYIIGIVKSARKIMRQDTGTDSDIIYLAKNESEKWGMPNSQQ